VDGPWAEDQGLQASTDVHKEECTRQQQPNLYTMHICTCAARLYLKHSSWMCWTCYYRLAARLHQPFVRDGTSSHWIDADSECLQMHLHPCTHQGHKSGIQAVMQMAPLSMFLGDLLNDGYCTPRSTSFLCLNRQIHLALSIRGDARANTDRRHGLSRSPR
jgi:hypothetical protein